MHGKLYVYKALLCRRFVIATDWKQSKYLSAASLLNEYNEILYNWEKMKKSYIMERNDLQDISLTEKTIERIACVYDM